MPILSDYIAQSTKNKDADEILQSNILASSHSLAEYSAADLEYINNNKSQKKTKTSSSDHAANEDGKDLQKKSTTGVSCDNVYKGGETPGKASFSGRSMGQSLSAVRDDNSSKRTNTSIVSKIPLIKEIKKKNDSNMKSKNISFAQHDAHGTEVGVNSKVSPILFLQQSSQNDPK